MKTSLYILTFLLSSISIFGAQVETEKEESPIKDRFLELIYEKAVKYTEKGEMAVEKAVDLVAQEAPILIQEFVTYRFFYHSILGYLVILAWFIVSVAVLISFFSWIRSDWNFEKGMITFVILVIGLMILGPMTGVNGHHIFDAIQVKVAPRVYIIEQTVELFKK